MVMENDVKPGKVNPMVGHPVQSNLENIGNGSTLTESDALWMIRLIEILDDHGEYRKAIYLNQFVTRAGRVPNVTCDLPCAGPSHV